MDVKVSAQYSPKERFQYAVERFARDVERFGAMDLDLDDPTIRLADFLPALFGGTNNDRTAY